MTPDTRSLDAGLLAIAYIIGKESVIAYGITEPK
jgi:hypothetical protein